MAVRTNGWRIAGRVLGALAFGAILLTKQDFVGAAISAAFWWGILEGIGWVVDRTKVTTAARVAAQSDAPPLSDSEGRYQDQDCWYCGGDPRIGELSILEWRRRASVLVGPDSMTLTTAVGEKPITVHYPTAGFELLVGSAQCWCRRNTTLQTLRANEIQNVPTNHVYVLVKDPNAIVRAFWVALRFRSDYFASLFLRKVQESFGLIAASEIHRRHREAIIESARLNPSRRRNASGQMFVAVIAASAIALAVIFVVALASSNSRTTAPADTGQNKDEAAVPSDSNENRSWKQ